MDPGRTCNDSRAEELSSAAERGRTRSCRLGGASGADEDADNDEDEDEDDDEEDDDNDAPTPPFDAPKKPRRELVVGSDEDEAESSPPSPSLTSCTSLPNSDAGGY